MIVYFCWPGYYLGKSNLIQFDEHSYDMCSTGFQGIKSWFSKRIIPKNALHSTSGLLVNCPEWRQKNDGFDGGIHSLIPYRVAI